MEEGPSAIERPQPPPAGYFEGESMTRRKVFTVGAQALGGVAGLAVVLPAVGFAVAPIFHAARSAGRRSARPATSTISPTSTWFHPGPGDRRGRENDGLRSQAARSRSSEDPNTYIAISTAAPTWAARSPSCRPPATSSAPATAASTTSRASGSAGRRCGRWTASRPGSATARSRSARATASPRSFEPVRARDPGEFTGGIWDYIYPPRPDAFPPP